MERNINGFSLVWTDYIFYWLCLLLSDYTEVKRFLKNLYVYTGKLMLSFGKRVNSFSKTYDKIFDSLYLFHGFSENFRNIFRKFQKHNVNFHFVAKLKIIFHGINCQAKILDRKKQIRIILIFMPWISIKFYRNWMSKNRLISHSSRRRGRPGYFT